MQDESNRPEPISPLLKRALLHPERVEILDYLTQKKYGTGMRRTELARVLGLSAAKVAYHLLVLDDTDLIVRIKNQGQRSPKCSCKVPASTDL